MNPWMDHTDILAWLREEDPARLDRLWRLADHTRRAFVGNAVHLRGLIEISNHCVRQCAYCGLRAGNRALPRYRMNETEIVEAARQARAYGYGTVVLQAGEDFGLEAPWLARVVRRIKTETGLAVTLSLGERAEAELALWRQAGADRYLLRFETSDRALFNAIHPQRGGPLADRIAILRCLRQLGYEIGSGIMIGIPGQTFESLAQDLRLFRELDLDMIGIGPYLPHPATPLGRGWFRAAPGDQQVPNLEKMVYKVVALARLLCPEANIPSTTALATLNTRNGRELGLQRGANVVMPNLTPMPYRPLYQIYPAKPCLEQTGRACHVELTARIAALGRQIGRGPGSRSRGPTRATGLEMQELEFCGRRS